MKYAIFSDIHGNLEALEAVLDHCSDCKAGFYICLGDVVGYGANPNECIERVRAIGNSECLRGNHDAAVVDPDERSFFHEVALEGIAFIRGPWPTEARDAAVARGVTIIGLAILDFDDGLVEHFRDEVIGGPGAFVLTANGFGDFARAVVKKLLQELNLAAATGARPGDPSTELDPLPSSRP